MKRHSYNKRYAECKKTASPACCGIHCCGNRFGVHGGRVKRNTRRYYRHATKNNWRKELEIDLTLTNGEILEFKQAMEILFGVECQ